MLTFAPAQLCCLYHRISTGIWLTTDDVRHERLSYLSCCGLRGSNKYILNVREMGRVSEIWGLVTVVRLSIAVGATPWIQLGLGVGLAIMCEQLISYVPTSGAPNMR